MVFVGFINPSPSYKMGPAAGDQPKTLFVVKDRTPVFPRALSFEQCEGDQTAEHIEFTTDIRVPTSSLINLKPGMMFPFNAMPLYHAHVLWTFTPCLHHHKEGPYELFLCSTGSHLTKNYAPAGCFGENDPDALCAPDILAASFTFLDKQEQAKGSFELFQSPMELRSTRRFTHEELVAYADGDVITIRLCLIIARSYFGLSKLLEKPTTVSESIADLVAQILRGEKPAGSDFPISVVSEDNVADRGPPYKYDKYYIHADVLDAASHDRFKKILAASRLCLGGDRSHVMHYFTPEDMPVVISLIYGVDPPLPSNVLRAAILGRALNNIFPDSIMFGVLFPQWERVICEQALALDKRSLSSLSTLTQLLVLIFICPYGTMPVAKRVALGVFADMMWLHAPPHMKEIGEFIGKDPVVHEALGFDSHLIQLQRIMQAVDIHAFMVSTVRKVGLGPAKNEDEKKSPPATSPARDLSSPTVIPATVIPPTVIPVEEEEEVAEPVENEEPAKWQCTIS